MMTPPIRYAKFANKLKCHLIPASEFFDVASETKSLFDRACQISVTEDLSSGCGRVKGNIYRQLRSNETSEFVGISHGVKAFVNDCDYRKFYEEVAIFFKDEVTLKTLAELYNGCADDSVSEDSLFALMLKEGDNWPRRAVALQSERTKKVDAERDELINKLISGMLVFGMLAYVFENMAFLGMAGLAFICLLLQIDVNRDWGSSK